MKIGTILQISKANSILYFIALILLVQIEVVLDSCQQEASLIVCLRRIIANKTVTRQASFLGKYINRSLLCILKSLK